MDARRDKLQGVVISLPTFCDNDYNLLLDRQRTHIGWLIEQGMVEGTAVLMGSAGLGEGYFLGDDEFERIVDVLAEEAAGRVPTMVGVFELSAREAAKKATYAARAGIDIVQLALPHYMAPSEDDVFGHFQYVNDHADIAIMAYNTPWAMPKPEFELSAGLLERFIELEHVVGVKWASHDINHYLAILRQFADRFNFIDNMVIFSLGFRLGMKGFIWPRANAAPRLGLRWWDMIRSERFDDFDKEFLRMQFDPFVTVVAPEAQAWVGMGEGPTARLALEVMSLDSGPPFPAQATPPDEYMESARRAMESSGILDWVDWDQSIFDE